MQVLHMPLQAFQTMAKRESIKRAVERKTADFQRLFIDDLNMVKKQFDLLKRVPPADPVLPRYAGQATTALVLAKRVDNTWQALQVCLLLTVLITFCHHLCTTTIVLYAVLPARRTQLTFTMPFYLSKLRMMACLLLVCSSSAIITS